MTGSSLTDVNGSGCVRDEAHRFAIIFHRQQRSKKMTTSVLDDIPGMGPKRVRAVWKVFANLEALGKADAEEIAKRAGLLAALAEAVRERARSVGEGI